MRRLNSTHGPIHARAWPGAVVVVACAYSLALASPARAIPPYDDLVPGRWTVVSTNSIRDMDPCPTRDCSYSAVEGLSGVVNDWNGGVFASGYGTHGGLVAWGGGHNGYFGSEIYVFDVATQTWARETEPYDDGSSSVAPRCSAEGIYPDGSACPTHSYNAIEYRPSTNTLVILNGTADPVAGGAIDGRAHLFNFTDHTWALGARNTGRVGYDAPGAYDPTRDIFWQMYGYVYHFASYDPSRDEWTDHGSPGVWEIDGAGKVDPVRDLFVFIDSRGTGRMFAIPLSAPTTPMVELTTTGDTEIQSQSAIGFEWEPVSERFVAWSAGADVYVLTPPAGDWRTAAWAWSRVSPDAGNTVVPTANSNGTYGRFRYAATVNAFLLVSEYDGPVWAYRLSPGAGTGPNPLRDAGVGAVDGSVASADAGGGALDAGGGGGAPGADSGCGCAAAPTDGQGLWALSMGALGVAARRRRRRERGGMRVLGSPPGRGKT